MVRIPSRVWLLFGWASLVGSTSLSLESETSRLLRGRSEALRTGAPAVAAGERLLARTALPRFYDARVFEPAWTDEAGLRAYRQLTTAIEASVEHGFDPEHYHLSAMRPLAASVRAGTAVAADSADFDLLASDAFMTLGSHLLVGRINPETVNPEWVANRRSAELHSVLTEALRTRDIAGSLAGLAPPQPRYAALLREVDRLRSIDEAGGWPPVADGPTLEVESTGPRVTALLGRLGLSTTTEGEDVFTEDVAAAVRTFQQRHGLDVDGRVGPATLRALNVSAEARVRQIEANLERFRWLPADLGRRHIEVNIAGFDVRVIEDREVVRRHRAVVGRMYRETPMFTGQMTYMVLAPYWHVPPTIAAVDKFPAIQRDPSTIAAQRMTLLSQTTNEPVDPAVVDWASLDGRSFNRSYRLRQEPGPTNALGNVKFMFPNAHNVYLHDTPSRELFDRTVRNFSSGCIRIEDPLGLAEYLLADQSGWSREEIDRVVAGRVERAVRLTAPLPVHLLYWTVWAESDGSIHFRDDIYGRDRAVLAALAQGPPEA